MTSKVKYNAGEGLLSGDLGDMQDFQRKALFDSVLLNLAADNETTWNDLHAGSGLRLRPLGSAGFLQRIDANTVRVNGGLWVSYTVGTAANSSAPTAKVANKDTAVDLTIANAPSGQFRRDIIQCQLVEADQSPVSRHIKDATTGALSSSSVVKRTDTTVTYAVKAGTAQASSTLANANEPVADAGWIKIASLLASDTGLALTTGTFWTTDYWDWREPWGGNYADTLLGDTPPSNWTGSLNVFQTTASSAVVNLFAPNLTRSVTDGAMNCRVMRILLGLAWFGTPAAGTLILKRQVIDPVSGINLVEPISFVGSNGDVSARGGGVGGAQVLYGTYSDPPLWSNGYPNANGTLGRHKIFVRVDPQGAPKKTLNGVIWHTLGTL